MCTAVVGGLIHRAATSMSAAIDQRTAAAKRSHRAQDRSKLFREGTSRTPGGASALPVTFGTDSLGCSEIVSDKFEFITETSNALCTRLPSATPPGRGAATTLLHPEYVLPRARRSQQNNPLLSERRQRHSRQGMTCAGPDFLSLPQRCPRATAAADERGRD